MATNKLNKNFVLDLRITSARNVSVEILIAQERQIKKAYHHMVNKTVEAMRNANSRQH